MDIEEDVELSLILGHSFMKTVRIIIDVDERMLKVRALDDEVTFNIFDIWQHYDKEKDCLKIDAPKKVFPETKKQLHPSNM